MGLGFRVFIVDDDYSLNRIPTTRFHRLFEADSDECLPQYSGKNKRCVIAILEVDGRKPLYVRHIDYIILNFDSKGRIDKDELERRKRMAVQSLPPLFEDKKSSTIIDASSYFYRKRYENEFKWKPTPAIEYEITTAIFSNSPLRFA